MAFVAILAGSPLSLLGIYVLGHVLGSTDVMRVYLTGSLWTAFDPGTGHPADMDASDDLAPAPQKIPRHSDRFETRCPSSSRVEAADPARPHSMAT